MMLEGLVIRKSPKVRNEESFEAVAAYYRVFYHTEAKLAAWQKGTVCRHTTSILVFYFFDN